MFYGHLTLSRDFGLLSPYPVFYSIVYLGVWNAWGTFFLLEVLTTIMPFLCLCCYNNVIDKGCCSSLVDHILEEIIYYSLEDGRRVSEPIIYDCRLV